MVKNFAFSLPTQIYFGRGAEARTGELASRYGKRVLLVYGSQRVKKSGLLSDITRQLETQGMQWTELGGVIENPSLDLAEAGCRVAQAEQSELILAVGGGSVIDTAKAISVGARHGGPLWELYEGKAQPQQALPVGVVATMAATASEANRVSVLHNTQLGIKQALSHDLLYPKFAVLNPELTYTVGPYQTAAGATDIFAHAFERYFHKEQAGSLRDRLCQSVMQTVILELPKVLADLENYDARSQLMWAATVAHSDMIGKEGDFACHALSHVLTTELGLCHGAALGILMVAWCKYMLGPEPEAIAAFATRVWGIPQEGSLCLTAQNGISEFQGFLCSVGLPVTLREAGISTVDVEQLAAKAGDGVGTGGFRVLSARDVMGILQLAVG